MQLVVKYTDNLEEGQIVARPEITIGPDELETFATEWLDGPRYITRDGKFWASAKTGELLGLSAYRGGE